MNPIDLSDIEWEANRTVKISNVTCAVLYKDAPKPTGWQKLNPFAWCRYFRGKGKIIAYWNLDGEQE